MWKIRNNWMVVCLTVQPAVQEHLKELYSHRFSSLCTHQTSSKTVSSRSADDSAVLESASGGQDCEERELVACCMVSVTAIGYWFRRIWNKPNTFSIQGDLRDGRDAWVFNWTTDWKGNTEDVNKKGKKRLNVFFFSNAKMLFNCKDKRILSFKKHLSNMNVHKRRSIKPSESTCTTALSSPEEN